MDALYLGGTIGFVGGFVVTMVVLLIMGIRKR